MESRAGPMAERVECAVIGAGVIGLAVARALASAGREVVVLEALDAIGSVTSARNSEVIHAGIYYPAGSLKARLCRSGRDMLYAYLQAHGVDHERCGKLIVAATEAEIDALRAIEQRARGNGVEDIRWLSGAEAQAMEPALHCVAALLSPSTGIFDTHGYMLALQGDAEQHGAAIAFLSPVAHGRAAGDGILLHVGGREPMDLACRNVVNCAGLGAQAVARAIAGVPADSIPPLYHAKGNYFTLTGRPPFTRLVYPVAAARWIAALRTAWRRVSASRKRSMVQRLNVVAHPVPTGPSAGKPQLPKTRSQFTHALTRFAATMAMTMGATRSMACSVWRTTTNSRKATIPGAAAYTYPAASGTTSPGCRKRRITGSATANGTSASTERTRASTNPRCIARAMARALAPASRATWAAAA